MKRLRLIILVGTIVGPVTLIHAAEQRNTGDRAAMVARRTFEKSVEVRMAYRRSQCMNAVGSSVFCDCLNGSLPLAADFQRYIAVTTGSSANEQLSPDEKKMADLILATRDQCVAKVFGNARSR
jgi:hypothetical protein